MLKDVVEYLGKLEKNGYVTFLLNEINLFESITKTLDVLNIAYTVEEHEGYIDEETLAKIKYIWLKDFK